MTKMTKFKKALLMSALCGVACAGAIFGGAYLHADANVMQTSELFLPSQMQVTHSFVAEDANSLVSGLMVKTESPKTKIALRNQAVGTFSYRFEPVHKAGVITLRTFETTFTDESGASFAVRVSYGMAAYASIVVDGVEAGLVYDSAGKLSGNTKFVNSTGEYTPVGNGELSVIFNANTMEVFVGSEGAETLVWDLSKTENDGLDIGVSLLPFSRYSVEFAMTEYQGDECSLIFREFNDCLLDSITLSHSGTPTIAAAFTEYGVKGESYRLPQAVAADLWDGNLQTNSVVFAPNGEKVAENNARFIPKESGEYSVLYTAENARGVDTSYEYTLTVFENAPAYETELDEESFAGELTEKFVGDTLYIPAMTLSGGRYIYGSKPAKVTLSYNGVKLGRYTEVDGGFPYTFYQSGKYTVSYEVGGGLTEDYFVKVSVCEARLSEKLAAEYDLGTVIDLTSSQLVVNNEELVDCELQVTYPNGSKYANKIFECNQVGEYTIVATGKVGEKEYRAEITFSINEKLKDLFTYSQGVSGVYGNSSFTDRTGYLLTYKQSGIKAKYEKAIDLSTYKDITEINPQSGTVRVKDGAKPLIALSIDPVAYGVAGAENYFVHLTDAADPTNSISIDLRSMGYKSYTYICAKAGDQDYIGFHNKDNGIITFNGQKGEWYTTRYGFPTKASFYGDTSLAVAKNNVVKLYYDDVEKQLLCLPNNVNGGWIICDFDDPEGCNGSPWGGFNSGKAYISIECGKMNSGSVTIPVYEIDGNSFTSERLNYVQEPTITVAQTELEGIKGYTVKVPAAKANDQYGGDLNATVKAYYLQNGNRYDVKISGGKFATAKAGEYIIVYTAKDAYGNIGQTEIVVRVAESKAAISATPVDLSEVHTQGKTGKAVPICTDLDATNVIGEYTVETKITGVEEPPVVNGAFLPEKSGVYVVTQTITDSLGRTGSVSYEVSVVVDTNPVAISEIPAYFGFIRGNRYELVEVYAKDYENLDLGEIKAEVYLNGAKLENGVYAPEHVVEAKDVEETQEIVTVEYKVGDETVYAGGEPMCYQVPLKTVYKKYTRKVGSQEREYTEFLTSRYFSASDGMTVDTSGKTLVLKTANEGKASFIQPVYSNGFKVEFDITDTKNENLSAIENTLAQVKITLIDRLDRSKTVEVLVKAENTMTVVSINGQPLAAGFVTGSLYGTSGDGFGLKYDNTNQTFYDLNKGIEIFKVASYADGRAFEGFSDRVCVTFEVKAEESAESAGIFVNSINGQRFSTSRVSDDTFAPTVVLDKQIGGTYARGEKIVIPVGRAYDVLSDIDESSFTVTVTCENSPVKDINGLTLKDVSAKTEYTVEFTKAGKYIVSYNVKDTRGGVMPGMEFVLYVQIVQDPVISAVEIQKTVKQGEVISIPVPTVTFADNSESNLFYIVAIEPDNQYRYLDAGETLTATKKGLYRIRYLAIDVYGNFALVEYEVICY